MNNYFMNSAIIESDMDNIYSRNVDYSQLVNKTILITGATGMLASYLTYFFIYLNEVHNSHIHIILLVRDRLKCESKYGDCIKNNNFTIIKEDINKPISIDGNVDYIIHAASLASPQYYETMPVEVALPNVLGTYNLLRLSQEKKVKSFLFFSSGDVYGKIPEGKGDISEDFFGTMDPLDTHSCYGESKRMGENLCASFAREYNIPTKIARIGHTYSPTMDIENDPRVFASFMKCVYNNKDIVMLSDGSARRPFCYIADAIAAFLIILLKGKDGEAYNVCNTKEFLSIAEFAQIMIGLQPEANLKVVKKQRASSSAYLENVSNKANKPVENKLKLLGWTCQYSTVQGMKNVLMYLKEKKHEA